MGNRNHEGYSDPTAWIAIRNVMKEERKKRVPKPSNCSVSKNHARQRRGRR